MFNMGLSSSEKKAFEALLLTHHYLDVTITLMDLDHNERNSVSTRLMDGQVTYDADALITRSLTMDLLDPTGALHLDSKSPDDGAMFMDRMLQVRYAIINPSRTNRYSLPVFTGPITRLNRNGAMVSVECQGKEIMGLGNPWQTKTFKKGYRVTSAIKEILTDIIGENKLSIPSRENKLPRNVTVGTTTDKDGNRETSKTPWEVAKALAASIDYQLYYDGSGTATMRKIPDGTCWSFRENESIKTVPAVGFNIDNVINAVEVFGKRPDAPKKGQTAKKQPHAKVVAAKADPLSPWSLGRSGGPRYLPVVIEDEALTSDAECKARADKELARGLRSSLDVAYDTLVIPHLEELDVVRTYSAKYSGAHTLRRFTVPLTAAGSSTIGYVRNVKTSRSMFKKLSTLRRKAAR